MTALEVIVKEIDEKIGQLRDHLATGSVESLEEYKRICGEIKGLLYAKEYTIIIKQNMERSDG